MKEALMEIAQWAVILGSMAFGLILLGFFLWIFRIPIKNGVRAVGEGIAFTARWTGLLVAKIWRWTVRHVLKKLIVALMIVGTMAGFYVWIATPLTKWFRTEGLGGGITIPSFILENRVGFGVALLALCALFVGKYLWTKHQKMDVKKEKEGDTRNSPPKTVEKEKGRKHGVLYMDNIVIVLFSLFGACWSVWWIWFHSTLLSKEVIAVVIGVIVVSEAWNIIANSKESLKWYQWIIRLWVLGVGVGVPTYYGLTHLTFGIR